MLQPCSFSHNGECTGNFADCCKRYCPGEIKFGGTTRCRIGTSGWLNTSEKYIVDNFKCEIQDASIDNEEGMNCTVEGNVFVFKTEKEKKEEKK